MFGLTSARGRAVLASAVLLALLASLTTMAVLRARDEQQSHRSLERTSAAATVLEGARADFYRALGAVAALVWLETPALADSYHEAMAGVEEKLSEARAEAVARADADDLLVVNDLAERIDEFGAKVDLLLPLLAEADVQTRIELVTAGSFEMLPEAEAVVAALEEEVQREQEELSDRRVAADRAVDTTIWLLVGFGAAAFLLGTGTLGMFVVSVVRPLASLRASARAIAAGDLQAKASVSGPDEVASLARDFNEMTDALLAKTEEYIDTTNLTGDVIVRMDKGGRFVFANDAACEFLGKPREELLGTDSRAFVHPEDAESVTQAIRDMIRSRALVRGLVTRYVTPMGTRLVEWNAYPLFDENGRYAAMQATGRDITERKQAEEALRESESKATTLLENIPQKIFFKDRDSVYISCNENYARGLNIKPDEIAGKTDDEFYPKELTEKYRADDKRIMDSGQTEDIEEEYAQDGQRMFVHTIKTPVRDEAGNVVGVLGIFWDITERKQAEDRIRYLAYHDILTGLPNRVLLEERLTRALTQARRRKRRLAVMLLNLDRFKFVNDTVGHAMGDQLLQKVAERLTGLVRQGDTIARVGSDEFGLLLPQISEAEDASRAAERVLEGLRRPWGLAAHEFHVTASIGIAMYPGDGEDAETILRDADTAMYRAKDQGGDSFQVFTPSMNAHVQARVGLESALRRALEREEFVLHYQPQINIHTRQIVGVEALVRWQHPDRGLVPPDEFIPLAEETGLIVPLGEWVLRTACAQNKAWQGQGLPSVRVAVNLSARQFHQLNLAEMVTAVLEEKGLEPQWLELEITESTAMRDVDFTIRMLSAFREMGVRVSIDDFGTGYSSLSYLRRFPIDAVKIDRCFVRDVTVDPDDAAIVTAVIGLAHSMNLRAIAEGVETEQQLAFLREQQCHEAQGYLFSKPVPAAAFEKILAKRQPLEASASRVKSRTT